MTDKKFTDEEIIKALMCHFNEELDEEPFQCVDCPLYNDTLPSCTEALKSYALDLINRQKAEIERLKGSTVVNNILESQRIKRETKAEAYKEYHIKAKSCLKANRDVEQQIGNNYVVKRIKEIENRFDNILKEMVGEE